MKKQVVDLHALFEGEHGIKNKAGLSDAGIEPLVKDFEYIGFVDPSLPVRIIRYALDDEGEDILQELEMLDVYFKAKHFAPLLREKSTREKLFIETSAGVHDFLERLGKIYHALMNPLNPNFLMPTRFQSPSWLEALLLHASGSYTGDMRTYLQLKFIESLMIATGKSEETLVETVFLAESFDFSSCEIIAIFFSLIDFPDIVSENTRFVSEALGSGNDIIVVQALNVIRSFGIDPARFTDTIAPFAFSKHHRKRSIARRIIRSQDDLFGEPMKQALANATTEERLRGIKFFGRLYGNREAQFLTELSERENSEEVKKAIALILEK